MFLKEKEKYRSSLVPSFSSYTNFLTHLKIPKEYDKRIQNPELNKTINISLRGGKGKQIKRIYFSGSKKVFLFFWKSSQPIYFLLPHWSSWSVKYLQTCNQWSNIWQKFWELRKSLVTLHKSKVTKKKATFYPHVRAIILQPVWPEITLLRWWCWW